MRLRVSVAVLFSFSTIRSAGTKYLARTSRGDAAYLSFSSLSHLNKHQSGAIARPQRSYWFARRLENPEPEATPFSLGPCLKYPLNGRHGSPLAPPDLNLTRHGLPEASLVYEIRGTAPHKQQLPPSEQVSLSLSRRPSCLVVVVLHPRTGRGAVFRASH